MEIDINLQRLAQTKEITIDYLDEDIIMINDLKALSETQVSTKLEMCTIAYCSRGRTQFLFNGTLNELHENQILILPSNTKLADFLFSADFEFKALFFTDRLLQSLLHDHISVWYEAIYQHRQNIIDLPPESEVIYAHFFELMTTYMEENERFPFRTEIIQAILHAAFLGLCSLFKMIISPQCDSSLVAKTETRAFASSRQLFQRFISLLSQTEVKHRPIQYYANQLFVSAKYLSGICKAESGKTAGQWISEFLLEDIRYQLLSTNHSIKEISHLLGFPNISFFGKYVKQHLGISPKALREQNVSR